nr:hypothetical protein Q903MT_gene251 [Picea sitchensis]
MWIREMFSVVWWELGGFSGCLTLLVGLPAPWNIHFEPDMILFLTYV